MRTRKALRKAAPAIAPLILGAIVMTLANGTGNDAVASASTVPAITRHDVAPHALKNVIWVWSIKEPYLHTPGG